MSKKSGRFRPRGDELHVPAIETRQCGRSLYCFVVEGKRVHEFASVSRIHRSEGEIHGYQRPEATSDGIVHLVAREVIPEGSDHATPNAEGRAGG